VVTSKIEKLKEKGDAVLKSLEVLRKAFEAYPYREVTKQGGENEE